MPHIIDTSTLPASIDAAIDAAMHSLQEPGATVHTYWHGRAYVATVSVGGAAIGSRMRPAEAHRFAAQVNVRYAELDAEARGWVGDCAWRDIDPEDVAEMSTPEVFAIVHRHYSGGFRGFLVAC